MEKKFTFFNKLMATIGAAFIMTFCSLSAVAQVSCNNPMLVFSEDFGTGTTPTSHPDIIPTALKYQETGQLVYEGVYRVINNTQQKYEWHKSTDHTGNTNGKMLVVNGQSEVFFQHILTSGGFFPGDYNWSAFAMNVNTPGTCVDPLLTALTYTAEYLDASNNWVHLIGSPYTAAPLQQLATPTWIPQTALFTLPATPAFVTQIRLRISDGVKGGCGNDFAMDDISFGTCDMTPPPPPPPTGGPTPVTFGTITARQQGGGVSVEWKTYQELNSSYFDLEKSVDGNYGWTYLATVGAAGNSSVVKNYSTYDPKPYAGYNFYRLKQVDIDGKFAYSKTVSVKVDFETTGVTVLANPFYSTLTVNLVTNKDEALTARIFDMTGKQIAIDKWNITRGSTRKDFSNANGLRQGMYILTVTNSAGEILFNGKVLKQ